MKLCRGCGQTKEDSEFPKNSASPDGLHSRCKECRRKKTLEWASRPENKQREKERLDRDYAERREVLLARRKERYQNNKDVELARNKRWSDANREHHRSINREWSKRNVEAARALVARRRSVKLKAEGRYSKDDVLKMFVDQEKKCAECGCDLDAAGYNIDHIIPLTRGGSNWPDNLQLLCPPCNKSKGAKLPHEWKR